MVLSQTVVKNYDEAHKRFFSIYLRFLGGGGGCARDPFLHEV